jgi:hypothetical protein
MIKFFRHIRQNLLLENKKSKYFKYAVGEIVLVVIGILIALQINNWNEYRKDRQKENTLLIQLKKEFESNLIQLDEKIDMRNRMLIANSKLLNYIDYPESRKTDSINRYLTQTLWAPTFDPIVNDLISSGKLQLLTSERLKELLSLWTSEIVQITEEEVSWMSFRDNFYQPFLIDNISFRNILSHYYKDAELSNIFFIDKNKEVILTITESKKANNSANILNLDDLEDYLASAASSHFNANIQSKSLRKRIVEILDLIDEQLDVSK